MRHLQYLFVQEGIELKKKSNDKNNIVEREKNIVQHSIVQYSLGQKTENYSTKPFSTIHFSAVKGEAYDALSKRSCSLHHYSLVMHCTLM